MIDLAKLSSDNRKQILTYRKWLAAVDGVPAWSVELEATIQTAIDSGQSRHDWLIVRLGDTWQKSAVFFGDEHLPLTHSPDFDAVIRSRPYRTLPWIRAIEAFEYTWKSHWLINQITGSIGIWTVSATTESDRDAWKLAKSLTQ